MLFDALNVPPCNSQSKACPPIWREFVETLTECDCDCLEFLLDCRLMVEVYGAEKSSGDCKNGFFAFEVPTVR
jgi:hypothetical protein